MLSAIFGASYVSNGRRLKSLYDVFYEKYSTVEKYDFFNLYDNNISKPVLQS